MKRFLSFALAVVMAFTSVSSSFAYAQTDSEEQNVLDYNVKVDGENSLAQMLGEKLTESQSTDDVAPYTGYNVVDVSISGNKATVEFNVLEKSQLVISLYDDYGLEMYTSESMTVYGGTELVTLTFDDVDEMPEYFLVKANIVDCSSMRPLCNEFVIHEYTQAFAESMSKTIHDFPEDRVINLDEDEADNFIVMKDDVTSVEYSEGVNIVTHADFDKDEYIIENADNTFTSLHPGDLLSYIYGTNKIIVTKIKTISVDGTTVSISGDDTSLDDFFDYIKINKETEDSEPEIIPGTEGEGVTYLGKHGELTDEANIELSYNEKYAMASRTGNDISDAKTTLVGSTVSDVVSGYDPTYGYADVHYVIVPGALKFELKEIIEFNLDLGGHFSIFYDSEWSGPFIKDRDLWKTELLITYDAALEVNLKKEFLNQNLNHTFKLPDIILFSFWGINLTVILELKAEISAGVKIETSITGGRVGFCTEYPGYGKPIKHDLTQNPKMPIEITGEVEIKVTLTMKAGVSLITSNLASAGLHAAIGLQFNAAMVLFNDDDMSNDYTRHECNAPPYYGMSCIKGQLSLVLEFGFYAELFDLDFLTVKWDLPILKDPIPLLSMYLSLRYNDFGIGECPYTSYKVDIHIDDGNPKTTSYIPATITFEDTRRGTTHFEVFDRTNHTTTYLFDSRYRVEVKADGYKPYIEYIYCDAPHRIDIDLEREPIDVTIYTKYEDGSAAPNIIVYASGKNLGTSDENGNLIAQLVPFRKYRFNAYNKKLGLESMDDHKQTIETASLTITVYPTGEAPENESDDDDTPVDITETDEPIPDYPSGDYEYTVIGDWVEITKYIGTATKVKIPSELEGYPVKQIGDNAFESCTSLKSVTIPESVTWIGKLAFASCTNLTSATIFNNSISISDGAFSECNVLTIYGNYHSTAKNYAKENDIPFVAIDERETLSGLKYAVDYITYNFHPGEIIVDYIATVTITKYTGTAAEVEIPSEIEGYPVNIIDENAFADCTSVTSVNIPRSINQINKWAFKDCTNLTSATILNGTSFDDSAFYGCTDLTIYSISDSSAETCAAEYNIPFVAIDKTDDTLGFRYCIDYDDTATIIRYIGEAAEVEIPSEIEGYPVAEIDENAFENCTNVTSVTIPEGVTEIGGSAFANCSSLESITIPEGVTKIRYSTFYQCTSLKSITIPKGVLLIGQSAFSGCTNLTSATISEGVTRIVMSAFSSCKNLKNITLPEGVTIIGSCAFANCTSLESVILPDSVTLIGISAFEECENLKSINIPKSLTSIGEYAFYNCINLASDLIFPGGLTKIEHCAFLNCKSLTNITLLDGVVVIGDNAFNSCEKLTSIIIPDSVTEIQGYAFGWCYDLTSIYIPNSVTKIGDSAFIWCNNLTSIYIPSSVTEIADDAFALCDKLTIYGAPGSYAQTYAHENDIPFVMSVPAMVEDIEAIQTNSVMNEYMSSADVPAGETKTVKASFVNLRASEIYNFYVMKDRYADEPFSNDNLLYITQVVTDDDGSLEVCYIATDEFNYADVFVVRMEQESIADADILVTDMEYNAEYQYVEPTVTLNGKKLVAGKDYYISDGFMAKDVGEYTLEICGTGTYVGYAETNYSITETAIDEIVISQLPAKTVYKVGEEIDITGAVIKVTYANGASETIDVTEDMVSGFDSSEAGTKAITVTYNGKTTTFDVTITELELVSIAVTKQPAKKTYKTGELLDLTGAELTLTFEDKSTKVIAVTEDMVSGFDSSEAGTKTITVTYNGKTTTFDVTITELEQVSAPVFTPVNGTTFTNTQKVTITSDTEAAKIYYTTDGTEPDASSTLYTDAITITSTTTFKAIAICDGYANSPVVISTYTKEAPNNPGGGATNDRPVSGGGSYGESPSINGVNYNWTMIEKLINELPMGGELTIELKGCTNVPAFIVEAIAKRDAKLTFVYNPIFSWYVDGKDISDTDKAMDGDLDITYPAIIDSSNLRGNTKYKLCINNTNIPTVLKVDVDAKNHNDYINIYEVADEKLVFKSCIKIDENGYVAVNVHSKGKYVFMLNKYTDINGDADNNAVVNALDAAAILRSIVGIESTTNPEMSDYNGDRNLNALDVAAMLTDIVNSSAI